MLSVRNPFSVLSQVFVSRGDNVLQHMFSLGEASYTLLTEGTSAAREAPREALGFHGTDEVTGDSALRRKSF